MTTRGPRDDLLGPALIVAVPVGKLADLLHGREATPVRRTT
jgi:hypothetical protein